MYLDKAKVTSRLEQLGKVAGRADIDTGQSAKFSGGLTVAFNRAMFTSYQAAWVWVIAFSVPKEAIDPVVPPSWHPAVGHR